MTDAKSTNNDNMMAAVATIPLVGLIIYYTSKDASDLVKYYAKQSNIILGLSVLNVVVSLVGSFIPFVNLIIWCVSGLLWIVTVVLWLYMAYKAYTGVKFETPYLTKLVDQIIK